MVLEPILLDLHAEESQETQCYQTRRHIAKVVPTSQPEAKFHELDAGSLRDATPKRKLTARESD